MNIYRVTSSSQAEYGCSENHVGVFSSKEKAYEAISQELFATNDNIMTTNHFSENSSHEIDEFQTLRGDWYYVYKEQLDIAP